MAKTFEDSAELLFDSHRGVYIPQNFAEEMVRDCVKGVSAEQWAILEAGPDHEWYWEVWSEIEDSAEITDPDSGETYRLFQNGDVWLVPLDVEIPEEMFY